MVTVPFSFDSSTVGDEVTNNYQSKIYLGKNIGIIFTTQEDGTRVVKGIRVEDFADSNERLEITDRSGKVFDKFKFALFRKGNDKVFSLLGVDPKSGNYFEIPINQGLNDQGIVAGKKFIEDMKNGKADLNRIINPFVGKPPYVFGEPEKAYYNHMSMIYAVTSSENNEGFTVDPQVWSVHIKVQRPGDNGYQLLSPHLPPQNVEFKPLTN